jgi:hypothetical protein
LLPLPPGKEGKKVQRADETEQQAEEVYHGKDESEQ